MRSKKATGQLTTDDRPKREANSKASFFKAKTKDARVHTYSATWRKAWRKEVKKTEK
jgi:hypothetical protein